MNARKSVRIYEPSGSRRMYQVVLFDLDGMPQPHEVPDQQQAEVLARHLADQHDCQWKVEPPIDFDELRQDCPQWFDEHGNFRPVDRMEFVSLGAGLYQFNLWSGDVRLSTETGRLDEIDLHFDEIRMTLEG